MRILHVIPAYYPATYWGGPIFSVLGLNNALASLPEVELRVLTTDSAGPSLGDRLDTEHLDRTLYPNREVIFTRRILSDSTSIGLLFLLPKLVRWADVVHLTATYSFPTIPTLVICRVMGKKLVWSPRGALLDAVEFSQARRKWAKRLWELVCNMIIRRGSVTFHVTSQAEKEASLARIPKASAVIVRNGVNLPETIPKREWLPDGRMRLLFIGRISPKKGIENLLEAVSTLGDMSLSLRICGTGETEYVNSVHQRANDLHVLGSMVEFVGHVDGDEKRNAFLNADVCLVPSFSENFAVVVAEALASGLPVIVSHNLPQWREVEERHCGLWVPNDPASLAAAIREIRSMDLSRMGRNGFCWMKDEFGWEGIAEDMLGVYRCLM